MFAQINYPDRQGIPPTRYTIAQIGCFLTSFCNLESRFGGAVSPPQLNAFFRDNNLFIDVDDGVRDDVSWDFITKFNPNTVVTGIGGPSTPPHNNSIVKFIYNGGASTHFCLVNDINTGTIVDSWDGKVKSWGVYGGVKAWASYTNKGGINMAEKITTEQVVILSLATTGEQPDPNSDEVVYIGKPLTSSYVDGLVNYWYGKSTVKNLERAVADRDKEIAALKANATYVQVGTIDGQAIFKKK